MERVFLRSWWMVVVLIGGYLFYSLAVSYLQHQENRLKTILQEADQAYQLALEENRELRLRIDSQTDLATIEMTLIEQLGLVPENQIKVYFPPR